MRDSNDRVVALSLKKLINHSRMRKIIDYDWSIFLSLKAYYSIVLRSKVK